MSEPGFIYAEKLQQCDLCGKVSELRPYGPNREKICIECAEKNPELTELRMAEYLFGMRPNPKRLQHLIESYLERKRLVQ